MKRDCFDPPVAIFVGMGFLIHVDSVSRAHALLGDWPGAGHDPVLRAALQACRRALGGELDPASARSAFESFARSRHILAPDSAVLDLGRRAGVSLSA